MMRPTFAAITLFLAYAGGRGGEAFEGVPGPRTETHDIIEAVALNGANDFVDFDAYPTQAFRWLLSVDDNKNPQQLIVYYALACIFYASSGRSNKFTDRDLTEFERDELPGWVNPDGWLLDIDWCDWTGVVCDANGQVQALQLDNQRMFGIFAPEVQLLSSTLEVIDLFNNFYLHTDGEAGNSWIGEMTNLRRLFFGTTSFEYPGIPSFINKLTLLEQCDFSNTFYTRGPINFRAFENLQNLQYVNIGSNIYTTAIPADSGNKLERLETLLMRNIQFTVEPQTLDFLVGMDALQRVSFDFTNLIGSIPPSIATLDNLVSFRCTHCNLTGPIPSEIGSMPSLADFFAYENRLTGNVPAAIGNSASIQRFHVEANTLQGIVPETICARRDSGQIVELGVDCRPQFPFPVQCRCCTCCGPDECGVATRSPIASPAPTPSPTPAPAPPTGFIPCFSGRNMVQTPSGLVSMRNLKIGDLVFNGESFEPVYSFGHFDKETSDLFLQIWVEKNGIEMDRPLEISKNHLVFTQDQIAVPASTIVVGDKLITPQGLLATVSKIETVMLQGVFAPFTKSGKILVSGVVASNFITFQEGEASFKIGGVTTMNMHDLCLIFMAPHRLACSVVNSNLCTEETYTKDQGINSLMAGPLSVTLYLMQQNLFIQMISFIGFFSVVSFFFIMENFFVSIAAAVGIAWILLKRSRKALH